MNESTSSESLGDSNVYEISYILVSSIPQEKVAAEVKVLGDILTKNSAVIIADEAPELIHLSYEMKKSTGSGSYDHYSTGYFGWIKFSASAESVQNIERFFKAVPSVLRMLLISTVREKTYLGKRSKLEIKPESKTDNKFGANEVSEATKSDQNSAVPNMTLADMAEVDKSIDQMVKGA
ncbi:MAG: 30S ribosomal protein S6 [Patescibacteria group bacterium]|nr:30S ribosomal protein S6 [Patescibacteria group bacterium]